MSRIPKESVKIVKERSGGKCEARLLGCVGDGQQLHHMKSRGRGGSDHPNNLLDVCFKCHAKITDNKPGTERFRTHRWQEEGMNEEGGRTW